MTYWTGKTVIVSGGLGFIGSHFVEELARSGASVICLYRSDSDSRAVGHGGDSGIRYVRVNLLDYEKLEAACREFAPSADVFIHSAALDGNTQFKLEHAAEILDANNRLVSNVLMLCRTAQIPDVVLLSSAEVYSSKAPSDISEDDDYHKYLDFTENGYVLSKIFCEILAELYSKQYGMNIYLPRPTNVYGPRDDFGSAANRVIPAMIRKASRGETIEIWGNGKQTRSFVYVEDVVHATLAMIEGGMTGPLNIATKEQVSILELANLISNEYGIENLVKIDETKPQGVSARSLDVARMHEVTNIEPLLIRDGLKRTIEWYTTYSV